MGDASRWDGDDETNVIESSLFRDLNVPSWTDPLTIEEGNTSSSSSSSNIRPSTINVWNSISSHKQLKRKQNRITNPHRDVKFSYKTESVVEELDRSLSPEPRETVDSEAIAVKSKPNSNTRHNSAFTVLDNTKHRISNTRMSNSSSMVSCINITK